VYTLDGLTINFFRPGPEYATHILVQYYDSLNVLLSEAHYYPTEPEFSTGVVVSGVHKVIITFYSVNKPYRYLRMRSIEYGSVIRFEAEDIVRASSIEEIDPVAVTLPFNTAEIEVYSKNADFSIVGSSGDYATLQNRQPLDIYQAVNGNELYLGRVYLDEWSSTSDFKTKFTCVDGIGLLDKTPYYGKMILPAVVLEDLLSEMFAAIDTAYYLDPALEGVGVGGWIPVGTYRTALQQICFAAGAFATCTRSGVVKILPYIDLASENLVIDTHLTAAGKGIEQNLILRTLVTGLDIVAHDYVENADALELYNGTLAAGTHTIVFQAPAHDLIPTGATILSSGANHAVLSVATGGTVTLSGGGYTDTRRVVSVRLTGLDPSVKPNIHSVDAATLVRTANVDTILARVFAYYQQRHKQSVRLYAPTIGVGGVLKVDITHVQVGQMVGVMERASYDLTGGFTAEVDIVGVLL
jgi:hypothetical protein